MIKIANAPCSWGVLEFNLEGESAGYEQVLDEIKETGYVGTELGDWGFMPTDPGLLKEALQQRGLELLGAFVPVNFAKSEAQVGGLENALKVGRLMREAGFDKAYIILADDNGNDTIRTRNAGRINRKMSLNKEQWQTFANGVNSVAKMVKAELGMNTVFHHHCAGYVEASWELDQLMDLTDPAYVGLCLDTGHLYFAGGNPLQTLTKYKDRIWHIHFKDCDQRMAEKSRIEKWDYFQSVQHGVFCKLGEGAVDFKSIVDELKKMHYKGWIVVEQDVLPGYGSPKSCARHNRNYISKMGL